MQNCYKKFFLISVIFALLCSFNKDGEEHQIIDDLIATSERQLVLQKTLKAAITGFQEEQELFYKGEQTKELAAKMVRSATHILKMVEENNYLHLFSPLYLEELRLFAGIGKQKMATP